MCAVESKGREGTFWRPRHIDNEKRWTGLLESSHFSFPKHVRFGCFRKNAAEVRVSANRSMAAMGPNSKCDEALLPAPWSTCEGYAQRRWKDEALEWNKLLFTSEREISKTNENKLRFFIHLKSSRNLCWMQKLLHVPIFRTHRSTGSSKSTISTDVWYNPVCVGSFVTLSLGADYVSNYVVSLAKGSGSQR